MSKKENKGGSNEMLFPDLNTQDRSLVERWIVRMARDFSTDGGKTTKLDGAMILFDSPKAKPKKP